MLSDIFDPPPNNAFTFIFKCLLLCYASHIGWYGILSVLVTCLIQLHYAYSVLRKCVEFTIDLFHEQTLGKTNRKKTSVKCSYKMLTKQVRVIREVLCTMRLTILALALADEAFYIILPFMFLFGEIIFICCSYATIKMYHLIPMPFFLSAPCAAIVVLFFAQILFPYAASVYENSSKSLYLLKSFKAIATDKLWVRRIRATRAPRFNVGSMFYAKRSTKSTCFSCWISDTINAIILF